MLSRLLCGSDTLYAYLMLGKYFLKIMTQVLASVDGMGQEKTEISLWSIKSVKKIKEDTPPQPHISATTEGAGMAIRYMNSMPK